ncbi:hypothetical protein GUJ93_ZPchr0006g43047 [Zizania palustris]|uniref:Amino acid transporter transmembrane domain-containing protein n=1 Tax=Zizania palustris TaxID=103762 RepID=A0A8J5W220_ZIZPA|nr:hypothetical protein GUJ93_ZPchr0006g43047 [Zizania palustris]
MGDDRQTEPLLGKLTESSYSSSEEQIVKRTGTAWTATAHIITAVIGSGVLSLAWSVAQLGWIGGPAAMVVFAGVTSIQSSMLADCYISHDPEHGAVRNRSYVDAVRFYLGEKSQWFCGFFLNLSLFGGGVVYTLASATSMRQVHFHVKFNRVSLSMHCVAWQSADHWAIQKANCYHRQGHDAPCSAGGDGYYMLAFGVAQVVFSQIPGFHDMAWLSVWAAAMSFSYSLIGFGLGVAKVIGKNFAFWNLEIDRRQLRQRQANGGQAASFLIASANGVVKGGIGGIALVSATQKAWRVSQALGDIAFAYPFSSVQLEIEDTLRSPPPESETMKTALRASIVVTTFLYLCCGCFGYAAFGDATPGNLLTGFGFYEPYWLVDFANLCIVLHLLGGYQASILTLYTALGVRECVLPPPHATTRVRDQLTLRGRPVSLAGVRPAGVRAGGAADGRRGGGSGGGSDALAVAPPPPPREPVPAVLPHGVRGGEYGAGRVVPLIQPGGRAARRLHLLAACHPLPRRDVPRVLAQKKVTPWTMRWLAIRAFSAACLVISAFVSVGSAIGVFTSKTS